MAAKHCTCGGERTSGRNSFHIMHLSIFASKPSTTALSGCSVILRHGEDWDLVPTLSSEHFILGIRSTKHNGRHTCNARTNIMDTNYMVQLQFQSSKWSQKSCQRPPWALRAIRTATNEQKNAVWILAVPIS